ncbi:MAG: hypothetical protein COB15_17045 [Flavobacteriales bacterium]|nr:MAG: hypothetical protein COB15_17045 [Flavobacteriales bacterium]
MDKKVNSKQIYDLKNYDPSFGSDYLQGSTHEETLKKEAEQKEHFEKEKQRILNRKETISYKVYKLFKKTIILLFTHPNKWEWKIKEWKKESPLNI